MDTKIRILYMLSTRDPPQHKGHIQTESEGLEKIFHANGNQKKTGVAILISDKIDFFFLFIFKLYITVLVLPNIKMNPPQVYMCSPS